MDKESVVKRFDAYVKRCLKNRHFNYIRDERRKEGMKLIPLDALPENEEMLINEMHYETKLIVDQFEIAFVDEDLKTALLTLDMTKRKIICYYYFLGFSLSEISDMLSLKKSSVRVYKSMALKELKTAYDAIV